MTSTAIRCVLCLLLGVGTVAFIAHPDPIRGSVSLLSFVALFLPSLHSTRDWVRLGDTCYTQKDYAGAIRAYNRALRREPEATTFYNRGIAYAALNESHQAWEDMNRTLQLAPNFARAYAERGILTLFQGNPEGAIADCDRALQLDPSYVRAYFGRGTARSLQGNWFGAIADFAEQIRLHPTAEAYYNLGVLLYLTKNDSQALSSLTAALEINTRFVSAYYYRGHAYYQSGNLTSAMKDYQQAVQIEVEATPLQEEDEHGFYGRAVARLRLGNPAGAIADCDRALEICQKHQNQALQQEVVALQEKIQAERV